MTHPQNFRAGDPEPAAAHVALTDAALAELRDLARRPHARPDLPACRATMARIRRLLHEGPGFAVLGTLPLDGMTQDAARGLFQRLATMVARPVAQKFTGTAIYDVHDTGRHALPGSGVRPDQTNIELSIHNDNAYNTTLPEIVVLLCLRPAAREEEGWNRVLSFAALHEVLAARFPALLPRLYRPFPFDRQREHAPDESPILHAPIFAREDGRLVTRMGLHQIRSGYVMTGETMSTETQAALSAVTQTLADPSLAVDLRLRAGEMLFIANRAIGHSRTGFIDPPDRDRKRLMVRLWLRDSGSIAYAG
ncbi:TauD/TfdA family dioxygenase [Gluconacetobacter tumulisoli]|uniref:TauD/TfdA-like domain-containing protein n=1 Tax=Gluconacetobacter tumulisoli TaxID=1286189 RepID=A0A7W4PK94_9PROT|nr:TauD/TfdA family dioxygenase [Gluconacetobacter tumulisoli]MBB2200588.1 hypothetical protein [Gluconacetobacter tumulisoli]